MLKSNLPSIQTIPTSDLTWQFLDSLVTAILGRSIAEIPEEYRQEMVLECVELFNDYILKYVSMKFSKKDALRLQASQKFASPEVFAKFTDLADKFNEAYDSFLKILGQDLSNDSPNGNERL